jgi:hypothetical protein
MISSAWYRLIRSAPPRLSAAASLRRQVSPPPSLTAAKSHRRQVSPPPSLTAAASHRRCGYPSAKLPGLRVFITGEYDRACLTLKQRIQLTRAQGLVKCTADAPFLLVSVTYPTNPHQQR